MIQAAIAFLGGALLSALAVFSLLNGKLAVLRSQLEDIKKQRRDERTEAKRIEFRVRTMEMQLMRLVPGFAQFVSPPMGGFSVENNDENNGE